MSGKNLSNPADVSAILAEIRHYLPSQGPIKDFIHHNTLHMFQEHDLSFHEAIRQASRLYGSREYLPVADYRSRYDRGEISEDALRYVLAPYKEKSGAMRQELLFAEVEPVLRREGFRSQGYLKEITAANGIIPEEQIHPVLYRLLASYVDQGIASISIAENGENFWEALRRQLRDARPFGVGEAVARRVSLKEPERVIADCLKFILPEGASPAVFLLEILMAARGWSGLIAQIEDNPASLNYHRNISLSHYLALYLAFLSDLLERKLYRSESLAVENPNLRFFSEPAPAETKTEEISRLWHEALEFSLYIESLTAIRANAERNRLGLLKARKAQLQAVFCIDDREGSLRRHLEELSPAIETFATPGFFGVDAVYLGPYDTIPVKLCPVPVTPKHLIRGVTDRRRGLVFGKMEMNFWHRYANNLWLGWLISLVFGFASLVRLVLSIHLPSRSFATASSFAAHEHRAELHYERTDAAAQKNGYFDGYTVAEMAERVGRVLKQIGLVRNFGKLVAIVGHGSSSTNNPYFAAYDCGACSGRPGLVNARTFARMANRNDVRALLVEQGITIPPGTRFVGALHDTARDEIQVLDEHDLPPELGVFVTELKSLFSSALERNALERARRFAIIDFPKTGKQAMREVRQRTEMLFEPRPEYNHASNALAIVAPRALTEGVFFDRRAFFNSYDPTMDADGKILNGILTPLVPVCGGINLEYLFSRLDPTIFGAGSKLPHNVFSLVGVGNGAEGDLRTGLPEQMTEIHDPVRLLVVVEQRLDIVRSVLRTNAAVNGWIEKDWIKFCVYDYAANRFYFAEKGDFTEFVFGGQKPPAFRDSMAVFHHHRENITPAVVNPDL
ncbi:MAG: DUF2309 domain-containing protein [Spirochaetes bacterium]|nr:DUF2309 domain-containing protein [Spirochaetota bacterium]